MDCCEDPTVVCPVVCPKPRPLTPLKFHLRNDAASKSGAELLGLVLRKDKFEAEQCALSSSPPFFYGSPPCRTQNPVVQDAHFRAEKLSFTHEAFAERSAYSREQLGEKKAAVRVEGFDCPRCCYRGESIDCK